MPSSLYLGEQMYFAAGYPLGQREWTPTCALASLLFSWPKVVISYTYIALLSVCLIIVRNYVVLGKQLACAVGMVKMVPDDIRASPKGVAVENLHYLNDGLWVAPRVI